MKWKRRPVIIGTGVVVVAAIAAFIVWWNFFRKPASKALTAEEKLELLRDTNIAIGQLENGGKDNYPAAAAFFDGVTSKLPQDPLGYRNLTIARAAPTDAGILDPKEMDKEAVLAAIKKMLEVDGASPATQYLAGRLYARFVIQHIDDSLEAQAREWLTKAAANSNDAGPLYDLYVLEREKASNHYDEIAEPGVAALNKAAKREPDNLVLAWELVRLRLAKDDTDGARSMVERVLQLLPTGEQ